MSFLGNAPSDGLVIDSGHWHYWWAAYGANSLGNQPRALGLTAGLISFCFSFFSQHYVFLFLFSPLIELSQVFSFVFNFFSLLLLKFSHSFHLQAVTM